MTSCIPQELDSSRVPEDHLAKARGVMLNLSAGEVAPVVRSLSEDAAPEAAGYVEMAADSLRGAACEDARLLNFRYWKGSEQPTTWTLHFECPTDTGSWQIVTGTTDGCLVGVGSVTVNQRRGRTTRFLATVARHRRSSSVRPVIPRPTRSDPTPFPRPP